jgi:hypothetical protein
MPGNDGGSCGPFAGCQRRPRSGAGLRPWTPPIMESGPGYRPIPSPVRYILSPHVGQMASLGIAGNVTIIWQSKHR